MSNGDLNKVDINSDREAIEKFLSPIKGHLSLKNGELHFFAKADMGYIERFQSTLDMGKFNFRKISLYVSENQDNLFPPSEAQRKTEYNTFVAKYNKKQIVYWKKAIFLERKILEFKKGSPQNNVHVAFEECYKFFEALKIDEKPSNEAVLALISSCQKLTGALSQLDHKDTKGNQELLNAILSLKNNMRSSLIQSNGKTLKGGIPDKISHLKEADQALLKVELKKMREALLKKHFHMRIEEDRAALKLLRERLEAKEKSGQPFTEKEFLKRQLKRWERKLDQGKPISIPKWYHMTSAVGQQKRILNSEIKYMKKRDKPGAYVANYPVKEYGDFGIVLSRHIEKTSVYDNTGKKKLYPKYSFEKGIEKAKYSDHEKLRKLDSGQPRIWLGFRRGEDTLKNETEGTIGIPIYQKQRVEETDKPLNYYSNTTLAYIYARGQTSSVHKDIENFAKEHRIQVIKQSEAEALWLLIDETFNLTFPKDWEGKIKKI